MSLRKTRRARAGVVEPSGEDEQEATVLIEKFNLPLIWSCEPAGFRIEDLFEDRYEEALGLIKNHFVTSNVLCRTSHMIDDPESMEDFLGQCNSHFHDKCSVGAICEETNKLVGLLILRVLHKSDYGKVFSRVKLINGKAYAKICKVKAYLNRKTDVFETFHCENFLRIYEVIVDGTYRKKGIGHSMMLVAVKIARSLHVPVLMGIFENGNLQKKAEKIGLKTLLEVYYVDWVEHTEMVFDDPGPGNYTIALMAGFVPE